MTTIDAGGSGRLTRRTALRRAGAGGARLGIGSAGLTVTGRAFSPRAAVQCR